MATLIVGPEATTCSACGQGADPAEERHETDPAAALRQEKWLARQQLHRAKSKGKAAKIAASPDDLNADGCGAPFTSIMHTQGSVGEDRIRQMRPDLLVVQVPEIHT